MTKQAAQKRFVPQSPEAELRVFARCTDGARKAVIDAQEEAKARGHEHIEPAHLITALLGDLDHPTPMPRAPRPKARSPSAASRARARTCRSRPRPRKALEPAHPEALRRQDQHVGVEHLLAGALAAD